MDSGKKNAPPIPKKNEKKSLLVRVYTEMNVSTIKVEDRPKIDCKLGIGNEEMRVYNFQYTRACML